MDEVSTLKWLAEVTSGSFGLLSPHVEDLQIDSSRDDFIFDRESGTISAFRPASVKHLESNGGLTAANTDSSTQPEDQSSPDSNAPQLESPVPGSSKRLLPGNSVFPLLPILEGRPVSLLGTGEPESLGHVESLGAALINDQDASKELDDQPALGQTDSSGEEYLNRSSNPAGVQDELSPQEPAELLPAPDEDDSSTGAETQTAQTATCSQDPDLEPKEDLLPAPPPALEHTETLHRVLEASGPPEVSSWKSPEEKVVSSPGQGELPTLTRTGSDTKPAIAEPPIPRQRRSSLRDFSQETRPSTAAQFRKKSVVFGIEELSSVKWEDEDDTLASSGAQRPWTAGAMSNPHSPMQAHIVRRASVLHQPYWMLRDRPSTKLTRTVEAIMREQQGLPPRTVPAAIDTKEPPSSQRRPQTASAGFHRSKQAVEVRPKSAFALTRPRTAERQFSFSQPWTTRQNSFNAPSSSSSRASSAKRRPATASGYLKPGWHRWSHLRLSEEYRPRSSSRARSRSRSPDQPERSNQELQSSSPFSTTFRRSESNHSNASASPMLSVPRNNLNLKRSSLSSVASGGASPLVVNRSSSNSPRASLRSSAPLSSLGQVGARSGHSTPSSAGKHPSLAFAQAAGKLYRLVGDYVHSSDRIEVKLSVPSHVLPEDSAMLYNVLNASRQILIAAADTQGDFSWSVPDPRTYDELPKLLVHQNDWGAFKAVMCDLRFLWRKTKENGPSSILDTYEQAWLSMRATGKLSQRLVDYKEFFQHRLKNLQDSPSTLFSLAFSAKQKKVREDCEGIVSHLMHMVHKWSQTLLQHHLKTMHDSPTVPNKEQFRRQSVASNAVMSVGGNFYASVGKEQGTARAHSSGRRLSSAGTGRRRMSNVGLESTASRMSSVGLDGAPQVAALHRKGSRRGSIEMASNARRSSSAMGGVRRSESAGDGQGEVGRRQDITVEEVLKLVKGKAKLQSLQEYGIAACLSEESVDLFASVMDGLMERVHSSRAKLKESGMSAYEEQNKRVLGLTSLSGWHALEQPNAFLELVNLWGSSDDEDFLTVLAFLPLHTRESEEKKEQFQVTLCAHIAEAARVPKELVDVVSFETESGKSRKHGVQCKVLLRFMEHVQALDVTVVRGYEWPVLDPMAKPDPIVSLVLRRAGPGKAAKRDGESVLARNMQREVQQTRPKGEGVAYSETPTFDETFQFLIFDTEQELVVTCYEQDIGARAPIGEIVIPVADILSQCHVFEDETYFKCFNLSKPGTKKQAVFKAPMHLGGADLRPALELRFHFLTLQSADNTTPTQMICNIMPELKDNSSPLRLSSSIVGPAFHDQDGSFDSVRVYVSSVYGEMHNERAFLFRYVFPALRVRCLELRLHFRWSDLSAYGTGAVRDDVCLRLDTMKSCVLRDCEANGNEFHNVLAVVLMGERTGRKLDARDKRQLEKEDRLRGGELEWVATKAHEQKLSVQEMEVRRVLMNRTGLEDSVVCLRDPAFRKSPGYVERVPGRLKAVFEEAEEEGRAAFRKLKREVVEKKGSHGLIRYAPTFESYAPDEKIGNPETEQAPDREAKDVIFGGLQQFGLEVFENLWRVLRQRFPSSRGRAMVNQFLVLQNAQEEAVRQYVGPLIMVPEGSQESTLHALSLAASFTEERHPYTVFSGGAGSGRSSLLARLLCDLGAASAPTPTRADQAEWTVGKKMAGIRGAVMAMVGAKKWSRRRQSLVQRHSDEEHPHGEEAEASTKGAEKEVFSRTQSAQSADEVEHQKRVKIQEEGAAKEEEEVWKKAKEQTARLQARGADAAHVKFLLSPPRVAYFFKDHFHSSGDVLSYLCSALLRRQDDHPPSWTRLQTIIRNIVDPPDPSDPDAPPPQPRPLLLVLDGLDHEEQEAVRCMVVAFRGKVRAIVSTSITGQGPSDFTIREKSRLERGDVVLCSPLTMKESEVVLTRLFDRVGAKKKPAYVYDIIIRRAASCPLYLVILTGYVKSCILMGQKPSPLRSIRSDSVNIFADDLLPVAEKVFGVELVELFLEIVCQERRGRSKKEVQDILFHSKKLISGGKLELLMAAFRPFSDTVRSDSQEGLSLNRKCILQAIKRRYKQGDTDVEAIPAEIESEIAKLRKVADDQERRIGKIGKEGALAMGAARGDGGAEWLSDSEDSANEDKDDDDSEAGERKKRLEAGEVDELVIHFGQVKVTCNQQLFNDYCGLGDVTGYIRTARSLTMDMNEASRLLNEKGIVPTYLPKSEVAKVFRLVNLDRKLLGHANSDIHELHFHEFLVFMSRLEESYTDRVVSQMEAAANRAAQTPDDVAATLIQKRAKGMAARRAVKEMRLEKELYDLQSKPTNNPTEVKRIIQLQALIRKRKQEHHSKEQKLLKASTAAKERESQGHPDVKGHLLREGSLARAQARLMEVFDTIEEAFVFVDTDGNGQITKVEFQRGFWRLGMRDEGTIKLGMMLAVGGSISALVFLRRFAWHDVKSMEKSLTASQLKRASIMRKVKERLEREKKGFNARSDEELMAKNFGHVMADSGNVLEGGFARQRRASVANAGGGGGRRGSVINAGGGAGSGGGGRRWSVVNAGQGGLRTGSGGAAGGGARRFSINHIPQFDSSSSSNNNSLNRGSAQRTGSDPFRPPAARSRRMSIAATTSPNQWRRSSIASGGDFDDPSPKDTPPPQNRRASRRSSISVLDSVTLGAVGHHIRRASSLEIDLPGFDRRFSAGGPGVDLLQLGELTRPASTSEMPIGDGSLILDRDLGESSGGSGAADGRRRSLGEVPGPQSWENEWEKLQERGNEDGLSNDGGRRGSVPYRERRASIASRTSSEASSTDPIVSHRELHDMRAVQSRTAGQNGTTIADRLGVSHAELQPDSPSVFNFASWELGSLDASRTGSQRSQEDVGHGRAEPGGRARTQFGGHARTESGGHARTESGGNNLFGSVNSRSGITGGSDMFGATNSGGFNSFSRTSSNALPRAQAASVNRLSAGNDMLLLARMPSTDSVSSIQSTNSNHAGLRQWMAMSKSGQLDSIGSKAESLRGGGSPALTLGARSPGPGVGSLRQRPTNSLKPPHENFPLSGGNSPTSAASGALTDSSSSPRIARRAGAKLCPPALTTMTSKRMLTTLTRSVAREGTNLSQYFADKATHSPMNLNRKVLKKRTDWISAPKG